MKEYKIDFNRWPLAFYEIDPESGNCIDLNRAGPQHKNVRDLAIWLYDLWYEGIIDRQTWNRLANDCQRIHDVFSVE